MSTCARMKAVMAFNLAALFSCLNRRLTGICRKAITHDMPQTTLERVVLRLFIEMENRVD